jgi:Glycosyl hydrolases family 25
MTVLTGCDISAFQSSIPSGQEFVILKATEGVDYVDSHFGGWWPQLGGRLRGAYHFCHPANDPVVEATHFLAEVEDRLAPGDLVVLDFETADGMSPAHCAAWAKTWLQHVQARTGRVPLVYTFLSFANEGYCAGLGGFPLWVADPSSPRGKPRVPPPWKDWVLHQYATSGGIDHDVFNGDAVTWKALGSQTPAPSLQEDDMISGQLRFGEDGKAPIGWVAGKYTAIGFWCDNTFVTADGTVKATDPCRLRVAVRHNDGTWQTEIIVVGNLPGKPSQKTVVTIASPKTANGCSVTRADTSIATISVDAS